MGLRTVDWGESGCGTYDFRRDAEFVKLGLVVGAGFGAVVRDEDDLLAFAS